MNRRQHRQSWRARKNWQLKHKRERHESNRDRAMHGFHRMTAHELNDLIQQKRAALAWSLGMLAKGELTLFNKDIGQVIKSQEGNLKRMIEVFALKVTEGMQ